MKFFACLLDIDGHGVPAHIRRHVESVATLRAPSHQWRMFERGAILTAWDETGGSVTVEHRENVIAVGDVRLDNRKDLLGDLSSSAPDATLRQESDLALVLRAVSRYGATCVAGLMGDFAFVVWDAVARRMVAACDTFAVRQLFYSQQDGVLLIGSRAEPLSVAGGYDLTYLGDMLSVNSLRRDLTVYSGVYRLLAASLMTARPGSLTISKYWSAADYEPPSDTAISEIDTIEMCRDLIATSVQLRLDPAGQNWAQLSGGIDSSTIVSVVEWLAEQGRVTQRLAGTLTAVDGPETGADERVYSDEVVRRWGIPNDVVIDAPTWVDREFGPHALPDQPIMGVVIAPRERRFGNMLRQARARVLLTGWGADQLFAGDMLYLADGLARGQLRDVFNQMAHFAAVGRVSFWIFAYHNAILPFLPAALQQRSMSRMYCFPAWLRKDTLRRAGITGQIPDTRYRGRVGHKYAHWHASQIGWLDRSEDWTILGDMVSVRHPFLFRPLVEFALRLPAQLCARPHARKWILREAMKGILPEGVRGRVGKGGGGDAVARMFIDHRELFQHIARKPILADLQLIDARQFREAVERASADWQRADTIQPDVIRTLAVEAWLQLRAGLWPCGLVVPTAFSANHHVPLQSPTPYQSGLADGRAGSAVSQTSPNFLQ